MIVVDIVLVIINILLAVAYVWYARKDCKYYKQFWFLAILNIANAIRILC